MRQVFISYRHENDDHAGEVRALAERLRADGLPVELDQFYLEQNHGGPNEGWPKWSEDRAGKSLAVLVISSPGWFAAYEGSAPTGTAQGAAIEARIFRQDFYGTVGVNERVRFVELKNFGRCTYPPGLAGWHKFRPLAAPESYAHLVAWLRQRVMMEKPGEKKGRVVYLAESYRDHGGLRASLAQELRDAGWQVLPDHEYKPESYRTEIPEDLSRAIAFLQLLEPERWKMLEMDVVQHQAALEVGLPCLRFRDPDIDLQKADLDPAQRTFLTADPHIRATQFDQFKKEVFQRLHEIWDKLQRPPAAATAEGGRAPRRVVRVVMRSAKAAQHWAAVYRWLKPLTDIVYEKLDDYEPEKKLLTARQGERACHGILFVCDGAAMQDPAYSPHRPLEECYAMQLDAKDDAKCPPVGVLYWPPPPADDAFPQIFSYGLPNSVEIPVADEAAPPATIDTFLAAVRQVIL